MRRPFGITIITAFLVFFSTGSAHSIEEGYAIYWDTQQSNAFPDCDGGRQLACQRGNGTTVSQESGWEVTPDRQTLGLDIDANGFVDTVYGWATHGAMFAYRDDYSAYYNYKYFYIGFPRYTPTEFAPLLLTNDGGTNYAWGWCLCSEGTQ